MGVPKFFRWLSERYPAISQLIAENRIPEFDCLYLDMNGIIHNCTHKDSDSPTFRMTEDKMFIAIFNYIEHLFGKIKPRKLFFMAIDGVAPRAKMNQQRSRRFRTALDAEVAREKAIKSGAEMPKEDPFDSNCITPGTEFMARLTQQLKYFINKKVSEDIDWQGVEVILSGHEVPGEGEHKIMEYIRQAKSQPDYDQNRRHCLYGLDADLIMLGLLSHDPHFCLLREEVTFGRQSQKKSKELEHQNFYLLHLCLVREYLELEFQELAQPNHLPFPFDMERVIDDLILMAFFVGNDFLPNLPHLHINEGALALMFGVYKKILPDAGGYINENGVIRLERLRLLLIELSHVEYRFFEAENSDAAWFKGKQMEREDVMDRVGNRVLVMSTEQKKLFRMIKEYVIEWRRRPAMSRSLSLPSNLPASDRKFVGNMAEALNLRWRTVLNDAGERHMQVSFRNVDDSDDEEVEDSDESEIDEESIDAIDRVLKKYENAKIVDMSAGDAKAAMEQKYEQKFIEWKNKYYSTKLGWDLGNEEELRKMTENYVQGLQWVLYYYYRGVASWPWFYKYHYSPMISDVIHGLDADMDFTLGQPFRPYQQLMGVLPDRSKKIVPSAYHDLMCNPDSPIIDFYPKDFELDMNGKKMEWEAVVKIPFIEEKRLLTAMAPRDALLSDAEKSRNEFGVSVKFTYSRTVDFTYQSSLQGIFPDIPHCHCVENIFELPTMDGLEVFVGLMKGVQLGAEALAGFPSLKTLDFTGTLGFHGVNIFQQDSRNESMVITLSDTENQGKASRAKDKIGKVVHVSYPFLQEAKIVKVVDELFDYVPSRDGTTQIDQIPHNQQQISQWRRTAERMELHYSKRLGIIIDSVEALVQVEMLKGLIKTEDGATIKEYGEIPGLEHEYAAQIIVDEVFSEDQRFLEKAATPFHEDFPVGSRAFFLGNFNYGRPLEVISHNGKTADIWVSTSPAKEREFGLEIVRRAARETPYTPSYAVSRMLNLNPLVLSKLTSSFFVNSSSLKLNLGLNLKFEGKKLKVLGYSRRTDSGWEYSQKAIDLIQQYMIKFPEFIAGIMKNPKGDAYEDIDFYPAAIAKEKMKDMGNWLKSVETKSFQKVSLDAEQLDSDVVMEIQNAADENLQSSPVAQPRKIKGVPRSALLRPSDAEQRVGAQRFSLGDRVIYVQDSGRVPIAQRGTVIGLTRTSRITYLDVVFDTSFMSGTTLDDRCSPFRGSTVPITSVLNITDKQRISLSKAASEQRQQSVANAANQHNRKLVPDGNPSDGLTPAGTPPALRGSFKNALGTRANRGRSIILPIGKGRGAAHDNAHQGLPRTSRGDTMNGRGRAGQSMRGFTPRGSRGAVASSRSNTNGYVITDLNDPNEGVIQNNPYLRLQSYRNVPPPASLNNESRGRGFGRGRGSKTFNARGT